MIEWITTTQAGNVLGLTSVRVWQLVKAGTLEGILLAPRLMLVNSASVHREAQRRNRARCPKGNCSKVSGRDAQR